MNEEKKSIFTGPKEYLEKSFLEELSYKMWSTKGARFEASRRLNNISKISNISFSILSAYLIIAGLIAVYNLENNDDRLNLINYYVTALSIIQLVLAQFENNQDYKLRAKNFHDCGLEISILYNRLRTFKTLNPNASDYEVKSVCKNLSEEYQSTLAKYENHLLIDYEKFKLKHLDYFEKEKERIKEIEKRYWWTCYGWYIPVFVLPPIILALTIIF